MNSGAGGGTGGPDYGSASYWDERYSGDEQSYDWYMDYRSIQPYLQPYLITEGDFEILVAGCGNSRLGADLYDAGFLNITNIDISTVVINHMSQLYASREEMEYTVMDARRMEYVPDQCFDLVVDKALMDALFCSEHNLKDVDDLLKEMLRVLKMDGIYFVVSHAPPNRRMKYFQKIFGNAMEIQSFKVEKPPLAGVVEEGEVKYHYIYICKKVIA